MFKNLISVIYKYESFISHLFAYFFLIPDSSCVYELPLHVLKSVILPLSQMMNLRPRILFLRVWDIKDTPFLIPVLAYVLVWQTIYLFIAGHCGTEDFAEAEKTGSKKDRQRLKRHFSLLSNASISRTTVPLHRIISLVSITSPRSIRPHKVSVSPSFVEFDMTDSGYGWVSGCVGVLFI